MKRSAALMFLIVTIIIASSGYLSADGDLTAQKTTEIKIQLGDANNAMKFFPSNLEFQTGKLYNLVLHNSSGTMHYFSSEGMSPSVFTRKAQVLGSDGKTIAETKGTLREIEMYPSGTVEWCLCR